MAGMDDDAIRAALSAYPTYLEQAMAAQREKVEPLKAMKLVGRDAAPEEQLKSAQDVARAMRSAIEVTEAAERAFAEAVLARIPDADSDMRQRVDSVLSFRLARRAAAAWMRDRMVGLGAGASAADPREALIRITLADDVRKRTLERIEQYEWVAVPALRRWAESCADVPVARARGADLDPISRRIAAAAPTVGWSTQIGTQLRSMLADVRELLPPADYEQFRTNLLGAAYPAVFSSASRADRAMLSALRKAANGEPDAQAATRNQQRYRDWAAARDARCDALMEASDRGLPVAPMMAGFAGPMVAAQAERIAAADGDLAKVIEDMKALRALADQSAGQLEGVDPSELMAEWAMNLPDGMGLPGESAVAVSVAQSAADAAATAAAGPAGATSTTTSVVISSAVSISTEGSGPGALDISGPVQIMAFSTVDGASMLGEGFELSFGDDIFGDEGMMSVHYSGGGGAFTPNHDQNIDETRVTRSMGAPRTDAIGMASLRALLRELGIPSLSQPAELAIRDSLEQYALKHAELTRALAIEWSGRDPEAPEPVDLGTPQEQLQRAMERGNEELRRASDASFIERRFGAWRRAPVEYAQLESALADGVADAIAIGADDAKSPALATAVRDLRALRALAVEQGLMQSSGRPSALDMGGYAASLDLRSLAASTPLSSADRAAATVALAGYEAALTAMLAQRREAAVEIERTNQLMMAIAIGQHSEMMGDGAAPADTATLESRLARTRGQHDQAIARGQSVGSRLEEWQASQSDALLAAVSPASRARLAAALTRARHPTVARDSTSADPQITRAMLLVESDEALLQAVIAVAAEYQAAYDANFTKLVEADAARQAAQADMAKAVAGPQGAQVPGQSAQDAARARRSAATRELTRLRTERSELNDRTRRALRAALGAQLGTEIADLPPRRSGVRRVSAAPVTPG
jgi:hypothetical protein